MKKALICVLCLGILLLSGCSRKEPRLPIAPSTTALNDLTGMSGAMLYSYVTALLDSPYDFIGQRFQLVGTYHAVYSEETGDWTRSVCVSDVGGCCQAVLTLACGDTLMFPDDGAEIEVTGTLSQSGEKLVLSVDSVVPRP